MDTTTRADFAQIRSRVGLRFSRAQALRADADKLAELWNLVEHRHIIGHIAKKDGGLRWASQMAKLATTMSAGAPITADLMNKAWSLVGGDIAQWTPRKPCHTQPCYRSISRNSFTKRYFMDRFIKLFAKLCANCAP